MKNIGILLSQPNDFLYNNVGDFNNFKNNLVIFYAEYGQVPPVNFPLMEMLHAYDFAGTLISTDVYTTIILDKCLCPTSRYFYVDKLEYTQQPYPFQLLQRVFNNKRIELLAANNEVATILTKTWKAPKMVANIKDERLLELL